MFGFDATPEGNSMDDDLDPITAFAELIEDMEKMAETMTRGVSKMLRPGWDAVILPEPDKQIFHVTLSAPAAPGLQDIADREYPNVAVIKLQDLPITSVNDFTAFMRRTLDEACAKVETRISEAVARHALTAKPSPADGWYEAKGDGRGGFLTQGVMQRTWAADVGSETRRQQLTDAAREQLDSARAEEEARRSIQEALDGE